MSAVRLVREELRIELQALLQYARDRREPLDSQPIPVRFNGHAIPVMMHLRPSKDKDREGFVLVIFDERPEAKVIEGAETAASVEPGQEEKRIAELERDLSLSRQRLQAIIEEYESSREEMKAANEEMQSSNEELRSTMEELETSKEELQSINEELQTVNQENRHKVEELSQLSSDLQNLLAATEIATLFLDRQLRILRFTPRLSELFSVRVTDRGRPISDLTHRLGYAELRNDSEVVLNKLVPVEREIQDDAGHWYLTRVLPYRSAEDRIDGVVISFVDITVQKKAELALGIEAHKTADELGQTREELRALTGHLIRAQEAERRRLAQELHDDIGQRLSLLSMHIDQAVKGLSDNPQTSVELLRDVQDGLSAVNTSIRETSHRLHPQMIEDLGLIVALKGLCSSYGSNGADVKCSTPEDIPDLPLEISTTLYRVAQEAIQNALKHAPAAAIRIALTTPDNSVQLTVRDNGPGFDLFTASHNGGLGFSTMRERARLASGKLSINSRPGHGAEVSIVVPIAPGARSAG